jgi:hypothetical protein
VVTVNCDCTNILFKHSLLLKYNCNSFFKHFFQRPSKVIFFDVSDVDTVPAGEVILTVDLVDVSTEAVFVDRPRMKLSARVFDLLLLLGFVINVTGCGIDSVTVSPLLVNAATDLLGGGDTGSADTVDWLLRLVFLPAAI